MKTNELTEWVTNYKQDQIEKTMLALKLTPRQVLSQKQDSVVADDFDNIVVAAIIRILRIKQF